MFYSPYFFSVAIFCIGLYITIASDNYVKKILGLGILQNSVLIFYVALGKAKGGIPPIYGSAERSSENILYSAPLPHVLMLTAIVVGFATLSVGLALIYRIYRSSGSVSESGGAE